jgi:hypothetical protein
MFGPLLCSLFILGGFTGFCCYGAYSLSRDIKNEQNVVGSIILLTLISIYFLIICLLLSCGSYNCIINIRYERERKKKETVPAPLTTAIASEAIVIEVTKN